MSYTVLIAEDDKDIANLLELYLKSNDYNVILAGNGKEAYEIVRNNKIDIAVLDIMMPEMDGYETMRQIRQNPQHRLLPILALTAKAMKGDRERCLQAGASDYIAKPVNTDELLALLRIWLFGRKKAMGKP